MNPEFRQRVFTPVMLPLTALGAILAFAFGLSRVLLAVPEAISTITAIAVALYVLLVASMVAARPRISSRALGVGLVLGFAGVIGAGAIAASAGMRELHEEEAAGAGEGEGEAAAEVPEGALVWTAEGSSLEYSDVPATATAGEVQVAMVNDSGLLHNVTFEGVNGDQPVAEAAAGETDVGSATLEAGTVAYYCSVPGHREAGMEGELEVG
jgi:plastocyanin